MKTFMTRVYRFDNRSIAALILVASTLSVSPLRAQPPSDQGVSSENRAATATDFVLQSGKRTVRNSSLLGRQTILREVDSRYLDPRDFIVTSPNGKRRIDCLAEMPADENFKGRKSPSLSTSETRRKSVLHGKVFVSETDAALIARSTDLPIHG